MSKKCKIISFFPSKSPLALLVITLFLSFSASCGSRTVQLTRTRLLMGNVPVTLHVRMVPADQETALEVSERAFELAKDLEAKISEYQKSSEVSCLNQNAGRRPCPLSPFTWNLLRRALALSQKTDGAFDIRFNSKDPGGVKGRILFNEKNQSAFLSHPKTRIGLGAIGKGAIVDAMINFFHQEGFHEVMVVAGGDLRASGGPWKTGIQRPLGERGEVGKFLKLNNGALATSGTYERGEHLIDPRTQKPVPREQSVTVQADKLELADALATAFFILGEGKTQATLKAFPGIRAYWTEENGKTRSYGAPSP